MPIRAASSHRLAVASMSVKRNAYPTVSTRPFCAARAITRRASARNSRWSGMCSITSVALSTSKQSSRNGRSAADPHTRAMFENIRVDIAFISPTAIDLEAGITADSDYEAEITRPILEKCAEKKVGLIYSSKFEKTSFVKVTSVHSFDEIITDSNIGGDIVDAYEEAGVKIVIV